MTMTTYKKLRFHPGDYIFLDKKKCIILEVYPESETFDYFVLADKNLIRARTGEEILKNIFRMKKTASRYDVTLKHLALDKYYMFIKDKEILIKEI